MKFQTLKRISSLIAGLAILAAVIALPATTASASGVNDLLGCSSLSKAVERDDGSIVAIGETHRCGSADTSGWKFLVGLTSTGKLLTGIGHGGFVRLPEGSGNTLLERPDGGLIVRSGDELTAYRPDGQRDGSFGSDGVLVRPEIRSARIGPDQKLYVLWVDGPKRIYERFDMEGAPDVSFGTGGQVQIDVPFDSGVDPAVDPEGRIYLVDYRTAIRLLPDGSPDPGFGSDGNGKVELDANPAPNGFYFPYEVDAIEVGSDGNFYAYGPGNYDLYIHPSFITGLDPAGETLPGLPRTFGGEDIGSVSLFGGGVAFSVPDGRWDTDSPMRVRAESWPFTVTEFFTDSQNPARANGTTALADGSLLAVGYSFGSVCARKTCRVAERMALLKLDANGYRDPDFGTEGKVVLPGNTCKWGSVEGDGDWTSCKLPPPRIRGSVELYGARSRRPSLGIEAGLGPVPVNFGEEGVQVLAFTLPSWLKVRSGRLLRKSVARAMPADAVELKVKGRSIAATVQESNPVRIWIRLKPGSVKLARGEVPQKKKLQLRAAFVPDRYSPDSPGRTAARLPVRLVG